MPSNITINDFKNSGLNGLYCLGNLVGSGAVTGVINTLSYKLFDLHGHSNASTISDWLSFTAGVATSVVVFAPRSPLVTMEWEKVAKLVACHLAAMFGVSIRLNGQPWVMFLPSLYGSISGVGGRYSLYAAAAFGALLGMGIASHK